MSKDSINKNKKVSTSAAASSRNQPAVKAANQPYPEVTSFLLDFHLENLKNTEKFYRNILGGTEKVRKEEYKSSLRNPDRNRFHHTIESEHCLDATRVKLNHCDNDFIHANYVEYKTYGKYICAQAPMPNTVIPFWQMIMQEKPGVVVALNELEGNNVKVYWPKKVGDTEIYGSFQVTLLTRLESMEYYLEYEIQVLLNDDEHRFVLILFTGWPHEQDELKFKTSGTHLLPDFSTPNPESKLKSHDSQTQRRQAAANVATAIRLVPIIRRFNKSWLASQRPSVVVHCLDGNGRTGAFVALDIAIKERKKSGDVGLISLIQNLSEQRLGICNRYVHYILCFLGVPIFDMK